MNLLVHRRMDDDLVTIDMDQDPTVINGVALASHGQVGVTFQIIPIHIRQGHMGLDKVAALFHGHMFSKMHIGAIPWAYVETVVLSEAPLVRVVNKPVAVNARDEIFVRVQSEPDEIVRVRVGPAADVLDFEVKRLASLEYGWVGRDFGLDQFLACVQMDTEAFFKNNGKVAQQTVLVDLEKRQRENNR